MIYIIFFIMFLFSLVPFFKDMNESIGMDDEEALQV
jgi:hypothetical protein